MSKVGFDIGGAISLGDIGLAIEYLNNKELFQDDIQKIKKKTTKSDIISEFGKIGKIDNTGEEPGLVYEVGKEVLEVPEAGIDYIIKKQEEQDKLEQERLEQERLEQERLEKERLEKEAAEKERISREKEASERIEKELRERLAKAEQQREAARRREMEVLQEKVRKAEREALEARKNEEIALQKARDEAKRKEEEEHRQLEERKREEEILASIREEEERKRKEAESARKEKERLEKDKQDTEQSSIKMYSSLDIEALYMEVRHFMQQKGISKAIVDRKLLEKQFGAQNIRKLIQKSYLISVGRGVTAGR